MTREEILDCVEKPENDEREDAMESLSEGDAIDFSLALCSALALVKWLCLKESPYDVFAIEYLMLAAKKHRDWKRLHRMKDIILASLCWAMGVTSLVFFLIIAIGKRALHEEEK